jgi:thioredoxin 1
MKRLFALSLAVAVMVVGCRASSSANAEGAAAGGGVTTAEQFQQEVLSADMPVLVDFYADWCPPCQKLKPIMADLEKQYAGKVKFVRVNTDNAEKLSTSYGIRGIPTVMIFVAGKQQGEPMVGLHQAAQYKAALDKAVAAAPAKPAAATRPAAATKPGTQPTRPTQPAPTQPAPGSK